MVQKIIWSPKAVQSYVANIEYLQKAWTQREIDKFIAATEKKLNFLKVQPGIRVVTNKRLNVRKTLIVKRILLVDRLNEVKGELELIMFFNTWQHPEKMK